MPQVFVAALPDGPLSKDMLPGGLPEALLVHREQAPNRLTVVVEDRTPAATQVRKALERLATAPLLEFHVPRLEDVRAPAGGVLEAHIHPFGH